MNMKENKTDGRSERLYEALGQTSEEYLKEAFETDSKRKLKALGKQTKNASEKAGKAGFLTPARRAILIAAASVALIVALVFAVPGLRAALSPASRLTQPKTEPASNSPDELQAPEFSFGEESLALDSIDKVSFFSGLYAIASSAENNRADAFGASASYRKNRILFDQESVDPVVENTKEPVETTESQEPAEPSDWAYLVYDLGEDTPFSVREVYFFKIELTDETGFLASKIGTGTVDVVINDLGSEERIITFRNKDRFYSCNQFAAGRDGDSFTMIFSTYRYIEGFSLVKNLKQTNYSYFVTVNGTESRQVVDFKCEPSDSKNPGDSPDKDVRLASITFFSNVSFNFTLKELSTALQELHWFSAAEAGTASPDGQEAAQEEKTVFCGSMVRDYIRNEIKASYEVRIAENDQTRPDDYSFLIRTEEDYTRFFVENAPKDEVPVGIDFDKKMLVLYTYRTWGSLNLAIKNVKTENGLISVTLEPVKTPGYPFSCSPWQRWVAVVIDRTDAEKAEAAIEMPLCLEPLINAS